MIRKLLLQLYRVWAIGTFGIFMLVLSPLIVLSFVFGEKYGGKLAYFFLNVWAIGWGPIAAVYYKVLGREHVKPNKSYIFVANHSSFLDSPAMVWAIPTQFRPLGKIEMSTVPVFGWMYRYVVIMVDRGKGKSRLASVAEVKRYLQQGVSVLIFAEGTMNKYPHLTRLQPFQDGAFRIAVETQTDIIPLVIQGSGKCLPPLDGLRVNPGTITLEFLPPISVQGLTSTDTAALKQQVFDLMDEHLAQQRNHVG